MNISTWYATHIGVEPSQLLLGMIVTFVAVGLKGFQHRNVNGGHMKLIFVFSYLMAVFDVLAIGLVARNGLIMAIPAGTGAAFGMVFALHAHKRFVKTKGADDGNI